MKKNNKGFSLMELIVSVAIFGVLSATVLGFVYSGSRSYSSIYTSLGLQSESQLALSQVSERLMDCNGSLSFEESADGAALYIHRTDSAGEKECQIFRFRAEDGVLYYICAAEGEAPGAGEDGWEPVAAHMTGFDYSREQNAVTVSMSFERRGKTYEASEVVSLRNSPG